MFTLAEVEALINFCFDQIVKAETGHPFVLFGIEWARKMALVQAPAIVTYLNSLLAKKGIAPAP